MVVLLMTLVVWAVWFSKMVFAENNQKSFRWLLVVLAWGIVILMVGKEVL